MTLEDEIANFLARLTEREREITRFLVHREVQAFCSEYSHPVTKDGVTRDVVIVEQLLDFLHSPSLKATAQE